MPFRDVPGHRRIVELLSRSVGRQTLPPSLLFAGSAPHPKQTAVALAQALNCLRTAEPSKTGASELDACGACAACTRIARGVHPDVLVIEPGDSGAIKIDQVRDAVDRTAFRPFEGRRRVVIVDQADALVPAAQNALLKTLEEPPASSVFVLVTSRPDVLLPTVRSRLVRLAFAEGAAADVDADARQIAHRVLVQTAAATTDGRRLDSARDLLTNTGAGGAGDREQLASYLRAMASIVRDVQALAVQADGAALANGDLAAALERIKPAYRGRRGVEAFAAIDQALAALERNAGVKVVADWLVLQL